MLVGMTVTNEWLQKVEILCGVTVTNEWLQDVDMVVGMTVTNEYLQGADFFRSLYSVSQSGNTPYPPL
jgi:hypothetical protein